jgi:hypothetical protein
MANKGDPFWKGQLWKGQLISIVYSMSFALI